MNALRRRYGYVAGDGEWMTQYTDTARSEAEAHEMLMGQLGQHGSRGGRVLVPSPSKPGWRIQAFHEDAGAGVHLPDGNRRVWVPRSQFTLMGIR